MPWLPQDSLEDVIPRRLTGNKAKATAAALIDDEADDDEGNEDDEEDESDEESGDGDTEEDDVEEGGGLDARVRHSFNTYTHIFLLLIVQRASPVATSLRLFMLCWQ